ncbi:MAG: MBL fold metallo-hydrolase [Anaerolineales bacterium]
MKNEIIVIGSGTAIPSRNHSPASILLKTNGFLALLDLGPGTLSKLPYFYVDVYTIENIFITHFHPDHTLDLATFFLISDYGTRQRNGLNLNLFGPIGLTNFVKQFMLNFPDIIFPSHPIKYIEMSETQTNIMGIQISSILSGHTSNSISYRFEFNHFSVVYTGDCVYTKKLEDFCNKADVLICECSYPENWQTSDHMTSREVGMIANNSNVKRLVITHMYPPALEVDIKTQISNYYAGDILLATDGDRIIFENE